MFIRKLWYCTPCRSCWIVRRNNAVFIKTHFYFFYQINTLFLVKISISGMHLDKKCTFLMALAVYFTSPVTHFLYNFLFNIFFVLENSSTKCSNSLQLYLSVINGDTRLWFPVRVLLIGYTFLTICSQALLNDQNDECTQKIRSGNSTTKNL